MNKKIVWLPYDMDTAIGINNEGELVFGYGLEDTDQVGSADVFNGQDSVFWNNLRRTRFEQMKSMYAELRSSGLSYDEVEERFENHQDKWSESIFNEDSYYKYIAPQDATYYIDLQGSKKSQRQWWLYNRFKYLDSKYNASGKSDTIYMRIYAKDDIVVTPYADIYAAVTYGSYYVSQRTTRNTATTLVNPVAAPNDTETWVHSAAQLKSIGDLSGLMVGQINISSATKLQSLKVGDNADGYENDRLSVLSTGNNTLLKTLDARNCTALATTVDISGCTGIEEVYFDGSSITGVTLPNASPIRVLHLPATITALVLKNQDKLTDLTVAGTSNLTTLWLEGVDDDIVDSYTLAMGLSTSGSAPRIRIIGFDWTLQNSEDLVTLRNRLSLLDGLDESGNTVDLPQLSGTIYIPSVYDKHLNDFRAAYPSVTIVYDEMLPYPYLYKKYISGQDLSVVDSLDLPGITTIKERALVNVTMPYVFTAWNVTSIERFGLQVCKGFIFAFGDVTTIGNQALEQIRNRHNNSNGYVCHFMFNLTSIPEQANWKPVMHSDAYIYVPEALVEDFKVFIVTVGSMSSFPTSHVRAIEDYTIEGTCPGTPDEEAILASV